jgi:hypothetical protein
MASSGRKRSSGGSLAAASASSAAGVTPILPPRAEHRSARPTASADPATMITA